MAKRPQAEIDIVARSRLNEEINKAQGQLRGLERTARLLTGAFAGISAVALGRQFLDLADRSTQLENRLKLVTNSTTELTIVQQELFELSQRTRTSFEGTVTLFSRVSRATSELGISQSRMLRVTETINQAMVVSGASAQEAEAALIQLSQGLAAGALRGEELNSVMEQTPRLAQAIAAGMGITIGQLRQMGQEGRITAQTVIEALESQAETIANEFGDMRATVGQAMTAVGNSFLNMIGRIDEAVAGSERLAKLLLLVSEGLDSMTERSDPLSDKIKEQTDLINRLSQGLERLQMRPGTPPGVIADLERRIANERANLLTLETAYKHVTAAIMEQGKAADEAADLRASLTPIELNVSKREAMRNLPDFTGELAERAAKERQKRQEEATAALEQVRQFTLTREQIELEAHTRRMDVLRSAFELELIEKERFDELAIQLAERTQQRLNEITLAGLTERQKFERASAREKAATVLGELTDLTAGVAQHNKTMFQLNKAAAIGQAIINTHRGVSETLANYPMPLAAILAATHLAAGLAQVNAIRSTSFQGGGGGTTPSLAGSVPSMNSTPVAQPARDDSRRQVRLEFHIGNVNGPGGMEELIDVIADGLRDRVENRDEIIFTADSRQASVRGR